MNDSVNVVGNEEDGFNVEVKMGSKRTAVFACISRESAEELQEMISDCSWFQVEER